MFSNKRKSVTWQDEMDDTDPISSEDDLTDDQEFFENEFAVLNDKLDELLLLLKQKEITTIKPIKQLNL